MEPEVIDLDYPFKHNGEEISSLTMRRSKVGDKLKYQKSKDDDADKEISLFCDLCEVEPALIAELDELDYLKLQEVYGGFLKPKTAG